MFIERRTNPATGLVELWWCDWEVGEGQPTRKVAISKIADEAAFGKESNLIADQKSAICWSYGRTVGNIAVYSELLLGSFPDKKGSDAILPCDFVKTTKYRHGAERWWCRTHHTYWGAKADIETYNETQEMKCASHMQSMCYVVSPYTINLSEAEEVGIWCSMPAAISTEDIPRRPPRIHVHVRQEKNGKKIVDRDFEALSIFYNDRDYLFGNQEISRVNITPPSAFDFVTGL